MPLHFLYGKLMYLQYDADPREDNYYENVVRRFSLHLLQTDSNIAAVIILIYEKKILISKTCARKIKIKY